jgi:aminoglycoside phosphotransferase family enzyme/predicted kinase
MEIGGERPGLVGEMLEPAFYPHDPRSVELRETHTSWVFLAGELAYKVKKPVVFPFLDYGTAERRREMCREEVRLNRRLAPSIYLEVAGITQRGDRHSLTSEDDAEAVEYAVVMRRVEEERSLSSLVARGELEPGHLKAIADLLARFHGEAPGAGQQARDVEVLVATLAENLSTLREAGAGILDRGRLDAAGTFTDRFLGARRAQFEARSRAGMVRDCHGDLRAEHVIVPAGGDPYIYDCIEFNPALRQIDVAADIAFLVMDLARLGAEEGALRLIDDYREAGGDPGDDALLAFLASYRAWVRAKVACLRALELDEGSPDRRDQEAEARALLGLGHRLAWRSRHPLLLVIAGVSGTGKTTLARRLADLSGWAHISSDMTRKRLAGLVPTERVDQELSSHEMTMRTYGEMGSTARETLDRDGGAIVDATFHRRDERAAFLGGLGNAPPRLVMVECTAPLDVLEARARAREADPERISDATADVIARQLADQEPPAEMPAAGRVTLLTEASPDELAVQVEGFVDLSNWSQSTAPAGRSAPS